MNGGYRFAQSFFKQTEYIHSTFDVGRSMFDVHQFLFRSDWTLAASGGAEHRHLTPFFPLNGPAREYIIQ